jgi:hypothetical protein
LCILINATKPTNSERRGQLVVRYRKAIKPIHTTNEKTVLPWLEEWETVMALGTRINLPETMSEEIWLTDFEEAIGMFGKLFISPYQMELMRDHKTHTFSQIAADFRRWYIKYYPIKTEGKPTIRGTAFEARFAGEQAPQADPGEGEKQPRKRQRAGTATVSGSDRSKRKAKCPACDGPHILRKCWVVMEKERPDDWIPSQQKLDRLEKKLQENKGLAKLVDEAKRQEDEA